MLKLEGKDLQLDRRVISGWEIDEQDTFTQRLFLASPTGRYLAWADSATGALMLRDGGGRQRRIEGAAGRDARFSADERYLAAVRIWPKEGGTETELVVLDLTSNSTTTTRWVGTPLWMEWVKDGVVVSHESETAREITYVPLAGEQVKVASGTNGDLDGRFTAARRGHRVMYFFQKRAYVVDVEAADADAQQVAEVKNAIENVEMAPDGGEATFADGGTLLRWRERGELERLGNSDLAHTIWYSADGRRLAYASLYGAVVLEGDRRFRLDSPENDLHAMRFHGDHLVVAMGDRALRWSPDTGARKVIGKSPNGQALQAADLYQGGVVLWTRELRRLEGKRAEPTPINPLDPVAFAN